MDAAPERIRHRLGPLDGGPALDMLWMPAMNTADTTACTHVLNGRTREALPRTPRPHRDHVLRCYRAWKLRFVRADPRAVLGGLVIVHHHHQTRLKDGSRGNVTTSPRFSGM
jgi:hypothetical protein